MRKEIIPVALTVATLIMGVFGAFLRWLQNMSIFEADTGLAKSGASISFVLVFFSLLMFAGMIAAVELLLRPFEKPETAADALHTNTLIPGILAWVCAAIYAVCALRLMFSAGETSYAVFQRLFGAAGIIAGACFPFLLGRGTETKPGTISVAAATYLPLFCSFWLVFAYRVNGENPVLWAYAPGALAIAATTLAFYHVCAWFYHRANPKAALVFLQLAAYLDILTLADERAIEKSAMYFACAGMMLLLEFVALRNLRSKT